MSMTREARLKLWRSTVRGMALHDWLPNWERHGGRCLGRGRSHVGIGMIGTFRCYSCGKIIMRGEGRWWE